MRACTHLALQEETHMRLRITRAFLVLLLGTACINIGERLAPTRDVVVLTQRPDPVYEELFPAYAELCAVSQYRPKEREVGGSPGHGVMYLKGRGPAWTRAPPIRASHRVPRRRPRPGMRATGPASA
jgi:hypothetical protein